MLCQVWQTLCLQLIKTVKAITIFEQLKKQDIFVRYFKIPRIDNYLRITIGTDDEMNKLFYTLNQIYYRFCKTVYFYIFNI